MAGRPAATRPRLPGWLALMLRMWVVRAGFLVGARRALQPRVVLATSHAATLSGNLSFIADELAARHPTVPVVVLSFRYAPGMLNGLRAIAYSAKAGYHLATARAFIVDDYFFPMYVISPRPGTTRLQVWHAAGAFKKFGYSLHDKSFGADVELLSRVAIHSNYSLALVSSMSVAGHYAEAFGVTTRIFASRFGIPRTDLFFDPAHRARAASAVRERYGLPADRRVLLYAPTFRGDTATAARYDADLDLGAMRDALTGEWVLLLRLHPFVRRAAPIAPDLAAFALDVSGWPDINELMLVADLLVTDYSSAIYEFALLGRPMAFFAPDHEAYERERGFYLDYRTGVPGPIFETTEALAAYVRGGAFDIARAEAFARASFDVADGHASERVVDRIVLPALRGEPLELGDGTPAPANH